MEKVIVHHSCRCLCLASAQDCSSKLCWTRPRPWYMWHQHRVQPKGTNWVIEKNPSIIPPYLHWPPNGQHSPASWAHSSVRGLNSVTAITVPVWMSKMNKKRSKLHRATSISLYWKGNKTENVLGECLLCSTELLVRSSFWGEVVLEMRYHHSAHHRYCSRKALATQREQVWGFDICVTVGFNLKEIIAHL